MNKKTASTILQPMSLGLILIAAIVQVIAILTAYGDGRNYFDPTSPLPLIAAIIATAGTACGIASAILIPKSEVAHTPFSGKPIIALPALIACILGALLFLLCDGKGSTFLKDYDSGNDTIALLIEYGTVIMLICTGLFNVLCETVLRTKKAASLALLGFVAVAAMAFVNVYCYFDVSLEMNAPIKTTIQLSLLFAMLYYTAELRYLLNRKKARLYLILAYCTVAASALPAFSIPLAYAFVIVTHTDYFAFSIVSLGILLTTLLRILFITHPAKRCASPKNEATATNDPQVSPDPCETNSTENDMETEESETE